MITKKKNFKNKLSKTQKQNGGFPNFFPKKQKYSMSQPSPTRSRPTISAPILNYNVNQFFEDQKKRTRKSYRKFIT